MTSRAGVIAADLSAVSMPVNSRTQLPTLMLTNLEIFPSTKAANNRDYILPLSPPPESKLKLCSKYYNAPHLTTLADSDRLELERSFPTVYPHDTWARIKWNTYGNTIAPSEIYTKSISHEYYSDPLPGKLPPIIYKWTPYKANRRAFQLSFAQLRSYLLPQPLWMPTLPFEIECNCKGITPFTWYNSCSINAQKTMRALVVCFFWKQWVSLILIRLYFFANRMPNLYSAFPLNQLSIRLTT